VILLPAPHFRIRDFRSPIPDHPTIVTRDEWPAARKDLLVKEKAGTHAKDALSAERRRLPKVTS
jgi:predicted dithiol-disulfide oxidoreductase (DUF899 family)